MLLGMALAVTACSAGTSDRGTVVGSFLQVGGPGVLVDGRPEQPKPVPMQGVVVARNQAGDVFDVTVGPSGRFRMFLPPGSYRLTGYSAMYQGPCAGESAIKVRMGKYLTHINVICVAA
jgi:hypothetical protein